MASNFLIDTSKKIYMKTGGNYTSVGPALLKGDIKIEALKHIGFGYKEEFEDGATTIKGAYNKFSNQTKAVIEKIMTDSLSGNISGSLGHASSTDTKGQILSLMSMALQMSGKDDASIADFFDQFALGLKYKVPYRKAAPAITQAGGKLTVEFAYGKCNLFDAKAEVWEPIKTIKDALLPGVSDVYYPDGTTPRPGLVSVASTNSVPYTQQALGHIVKATGTIVKGDAKGLAEYTRKLQAASKSLISESKESEALDAADKYMDELLGHLDNYVTVSTDSGSGRDAKNAAKKDAKAAFKNLKKLLPKINPKGDSEGDIARYAKDWDDWSTGATDKVRATWIGWQNAFRNGYTTEDGKTKYEGNQVTLKQKGEDGQDFQVIKSDKDEASGDGLLSILKEMVNYEMYLEGAAAESVFNTLSGTGSFFYLYFGYAPTYVHNQTSIETFCKNTSNAKIKMGPFIPEDVDFVYDMVHTDKDGYPMAGTITFNKLWPLAPFGKGLILDNNGKLYGE